FMPGIRMSISTTSGLDVAATRTAAWPSAASAATSRPGAAWISATRPARIRSWSSTTSTLVMGTSRSSVPLLPRADGIGTGMPERQGEGHLEPALGSGPGGDRSAVQPGTLTHAHQPLPGNRRPGGRAGAVVADPDGQVPGTVGDGYRGAGGSGVFEHVRQGLLDDPVRAEIGAGWQWPRRAGGHDVDRYPGGTDPLGEIAEPGQARRRVVRPRVVRLFGVTDPQ